VGIIITRSIGTGLPRREAEGTAAIRGSVLKARREGMRHRSWQRRPRMFDQEEVKSLLAHASVNMRAMLLLACRPASQTDLALAPIDAADLVTGWLTLPRAKTAIPRRVPLWPETVTAIR